MAMPCRPQAKQAYSHLLQMELEDVTPTIWRQVAMSVYVAAAASLRYYRLNRCLAETILRLRRGPL
jgi:hypothetical protein